MSRRRHTAATVAELLVAHGADPTMAARIVETLMRAGQSAAEARAWLAHPARGYPVTTGDVEVAGETFPVRQTPIFAVENGAAETVLAAAEEFAAASEDERFIARWFGGNVQDVRRLTGGDAARARVVAQIAERMKNELRKPEHVAEGAQTVLPHPDGRRMVDVILDGGEGSILTEVDARQIDLQALLADGELEFWGW